MPRKSRSDASRDPRLFALAAFLLLESTALHAPAGEPASLPAPGSTAESLSFSSAGHILRFDTGCVYVASSGHLLKIELAGRRPVAPIAAPSHAIETASESHSNNTPAFAKVLYSDVWAGVTAIYEKSAGAILKSSYILEPGASPDAIRLRYNRPLRLDAAGNLVISFARGEMREQAPTAWQEKSGRKVPVDIAFRLLAEKEVGFTAQSVDPSLPLVIDPALTWHTFLGSTSYDEGHAITVDSDGNVFVVGDSPTAWGSLSFGMGSSFLAKLDSSGTLLWTSFFGGNAATNARGVVLDGSGNIYVTGNSNMGWREPFTIPGVWDPAPPLVAHSGGDSVPYDAFVAKFGSTGVLSWHTFLGGSSGYEHGQGIALGGSALYVIGYTDSSWGAPLAAHNGNYDPFVAKLDTDGAYQWHTFFGGTAYDEGLGIAVDSAGGVYVTGLSSNSWGTPVRSWTSSEDAFAAKLNSSGALQWNTFLGGSGSDIGAGIAVDGSGNANVIGYGTYTWKGDSDPILAHSGLDDVFVAKLNSSGALQWNTFLGSAINDYGSGIVLDASGNSYITGYSYATWGSPLNPHAGDADAFAAKLSSTGALTWNMFMGGSAEDLGLAVALGGGNTLVTGRSFATWGSPVLPFTEETEGGDKSDAFVAQIPESPTWITLASFEAAARDGGVELTWTTSSEIDNAGFHLWRAEGRNGAFERITPALIPARGDAVVGADYFYLDGDVVEGQEYLYKLEDIDTGGKSTFHGPVSTVAGIIRLIDPMDGTLVPHLASLRFTWDGGPFKEFRIEFSKGKSFDGEELTLPEAWTAAELYEPGPAELGRLRALAGDKGIVFWRVRGRTAEGAETVSRARWLKLR